MEKRISVVIPNYNGRDLLQKNLPKVIKNCPNCEIVLVDDASSDDSMKMIKKKFPKVKLVSHKKNLGFARTANTGIKNASGDLILLLNSDVSPQSDFLKPALEHFTRDEKLFAVALSDYSHEEGKVVIRGRGGGFFKKGFLNHFAAKAKKGETLWVSGGSGLFDKEKLIALNSFDAAFAPFYWEDIDLSYRARKKGFICIFEPQSKVDHYHEEGAIKKTHSTKAVKVSSYKNQFLFVWKNVSDVDLIMKHVAWMPFHFVNAAIRADTAFFLGFLWALAKLPTIVLKFEESQISDKLSDKEVLKDFEK